MKKLIGVCALVVLALALMGCPEKKGPLEKAGEKMDDAMDDVGDSLENAIETVGDKVENATDEARDAVEDVADEIDN
jgi:hypothetical protein